MGKRIKQILIVCIFTNGSIILVRSQAGVRLEVFEDAGARRRVRFAPGQVLRFGARDDQTQL